jgi:hypothetical protein
MIMGAFLVASGAVLFLLRHLMARIAEEGFKFLPEGSNFKTYRFQVKAGIASAVIVAIAGIVVFMVGLLNF